MEEASKEDALKAFDKTFYRKLTPYVEKNYIKAYKFGESAHLLIFKYKKDLAFMIFGKDRKGVNQQVCFGSETLKAMQALNIKPIEILYKGKGD